MDTRTTTTVDGLTNEEHDLIQIMKKIHSYEEVDRVLQFAVTFFSSSFLRLNNSLAISVLEEKYITFALNEYALSKRSPKGEKYGLC